MPIETIEYKGTTYPAFQTTGNAARWIMPFAENYIKPNMAVVDIGFCKDEWRFKDAYGVDPSVIPEHGDAMNFIGDGIWDAIFSSHCLEHVKENWMTVLDYWLTKIKIGGVIFLYLPHKSQEYWLPENNRKHIHSFTGNEIADYLTNLGHKVIKSGVDLNNSFVVVCEKKRTNEKAGWKCEPWVTKFYEEGNNVSKEQLDSIKKEWEAAKPSHSVTFINTDTYPTSSVAPLTKQQIIEIGIKKFESGHLPLSTVLSEIYDCGYNADV